MVGRPRTRTVCHCGKPEQAKGLCARHYQQVRRSEGVDVTTLLRQQHRRIRVLEQTLSLCAELLGDAMPQVCRRGLPDDPSLVVTAYGSTPPHATAREFWAAVGAKVGKSGDAVRVLCARLELRSKIVRATR